MITQNYNGIIEDPRTEDQKAKDYVHEEIASGPSTVIWEERQPKTYPIYNQDGSSACVAFATSKVLSIDEFLESKTYYHLSPRDIYTRRQNINSGGMFLPNALEIATKHGACYELSVPSENKNESQMNDRSDITALTDAEAIKYRSKNYVSFQTIDMEQIASILDQGKAVLLGFRFDYEEWVDIPFLKPGSKKQCGHGVAAVDYVLKDGIKYIVIDDSWGPGYAKHGQRYISEEFLNARCFYAGYTINFIYEPSPKPDHKFLLNMKPLNRNFEVKFLQERMKYEGLFPTNTETTNYFGPMTIKAVKKYQELHSLVPDGVVGPKTREVLNAS